MLSGETSVGKYPIECVKLLDRVAGNTEEAIDYRRIYSAFANTDEFADRTGAVTNASITTAYNVGATAIITVTESGRTAQALSRLRPSIPIIAVVSSRQLYHQLSINWGITPVLGSRFKSIEELYRESVRLSLTTGIIREGDTVVLVAGLPVGRSGGTNMIKVETVGHPGTCPKRRKDDEPSQALQFRLGLEKSAHARLNQTGAGGTGTPLELLSRPLVTSPNRSLR
jgi:pyruvate kinase